MKKLLIVTGIYEPDIGGPASFARTIAPHLAQTWDVTVITYSTPWRYAGDQHNTFRVVRVWRRWPQLIRHAVYALRVLWYARSSDRILALSAMNAGLAVYVACRILKKSYSVRIVGDYAWERAIQTGMTYVLVDAFQQQRKRRLIGLLDYVQKRVAQHAERVIVPSDYLARIVEGWGVAPDRITKIYNGVRFERSTLTKEEARKHINISGSIILSWGRMVPWKGFRMLIKMMPQLLQINHLVRLVLIGDGPDLVLLRRMAKNMNLERYVHFIGRVSHKELAVYFAAADMVVLNTGYEGFSHQIVEALSAGVPVITTDIGGNPEIITNGTNGFLVQYNDEFELGEAIKVLWQNEQLAQQFIKEGRTIAARFTVERMVDEVSRLLMYE